MNSVQSRDRLSEHEARELQRVLLRVNEQGWGIAIGLVFGLGLFVATAVLVMRGGESVGAHLQLLSVYFPGYRVSYVGSVIGFVYAFVIGYGVGRTIGTVYNRIVDAVR
jgi:hypothetical protein